jgi:spore germination protein YaaH
VSAPPRPSSPAFLALAACLLTSACGASLAGTGSLRLGAWVTYWDFDRGRERLASATWLDDVFFFVVDLGPDGRPARARPALAESDVLRDLRSRGATTWMTVVNDRRQDGGRPSVLKDAELVHRLLADPAQRAAHRRAIVELAAAQGFSGVDIDYENLNPEDRERFTAFIRELAADLAEKGLRLSVTVQPKRQESRSVGPGAADWAELCRTSDRLQVMLYNLHSSKTGPGPMSSPSWIGEVLRFASSQCEAGRVVPILKVSGMDWGPAGVKELQHDDAVALLARHSAELEREPEGATPFFRYVGSDGPHTVYFEDATGILRKVAAVQALGYEKVVLWSLGREDPRLLPQLLDYRAR